MGIIGTAKSSSGATDASNAAQYPPRLIPITPTGASASCAWRGIGPDPALPPSRQSRFDGSDRQGRGRLVAPQHEGQRGNPVLIDRRYFPELLALRPGSAPRALLKRHPDALFQLPVDDPAVLRDLDEHEEYRRWRPAQSDA